MYLNFFLVICAFYIFQRQNRYLQCNLPPNKLPWLSWLMPLYSLKDPLIVNPDKPSPCLKDLPKEVLEALCVKLDKPLKGVGNWRHVATCLDFTEEQIQRFRNEMLTPDGSPCTVMLEALVTKSPQFTVAEFVHILQTRKIQRFDAVEVLEPHLHSCWEWSAQESRDILNYSHCNGLVELFGFLRRFAVSDWNHCQIN